MFTNDHASKKEKVKELLESVIYVKQAITVKKQLLDELCAVSHAAKKYGGGLDEKIQQRIEKLRKEFLQDINSLLAKQTRVKRGLYAIKDERIRTIFEAKYLKNLTWENIAEMMCYSVVHVKRLANESYHLLEGSIFW